MSALKVGIMTYAQMKARTVAIARGQYRPLPSDPKVFFTSIESMSQVLSSGNQSLLAIILAQRPRSLQELAAITGRKKPNLSRTLHTMERYGLVKLEKGERGCVTPLVLHDSVSVDLNFGRPLEHA